MSVVVVGMDFSELGHRALDEALALAQTRPATQLHVVHVASGYGPMLRIDLPDDVRTVSPKEAEAFVKEYIARQVTEWATKSGHAGVAAEAHLRVGAASEEVVKLAADLSADLIVLGTHGRTGMTRLLLGSVAEAIVRKAGCPVLIVRPKDHSADGDKA